MASNTSLRNAFQMPSPMTITGRSSSITAAFVCAKIPRIEPSNDEINTALTILQMSPLDIRCAYCGNQSTEWDHLHPLVKNKKPTGFITEIRNLVPSCGKCNQSKGNKDWKEWMTSNAPLSPKTRDVPDLDNKIKIIKNYETWGKLKSVDLHSMISPQIWEKHWANLESLQKVMNNAQSHAIELRNIIENKLVKY
jgi:hypothetical protein